MYNNNLLFRLKLALALGNIFIHDCDNKVSTFLHRKNKLNLPELQCREKTIGRKDGKTVLVRGETSSGGCNVLTVVASFPFLINLSSQLPSGTD